MRVTTRVIGPKDHSGAIITAHNGSARDCGDFVEKGGYGDISEKIGNYVQLVRSSKRHAPIEGH